MCAIEYADRPDLFTEWTRTARKAHKCTECGRVIQPGERYRLSTGVWSGRWASYKTCAHCLAAGVWLEQVCGGYPFGGLQDELHEHWYDGYRSVAYGRLVVGQKLRWHDGRDPVPEGVAELADRMLQGLVA